MLVVLMLMPMASMPGAQAIYYEAPPMEPMPGTSPTETPPYPVTAIQVVTTLPTSAQATSIRVSCGGPCGGTTGPLLDFKFQANATSPELTARSSYQTMAASTGLYTFHFDTLLPRAVQPQMRVRLQEPNGNFASGWQAMPPVANTLASFASAGTTTVFRGDDPVVKSTTPEYLSNPDSFQFDVDAWDQRPAGAEAPQTFTWNLGPAGTHSVPVTTRSDLAAIRMAPQLRHLTRDACHTYTVTVDDRIGQAAEGVAFDAKLPGAAFTPSNAPAHLAIGVASYVVERVCVQNAVPSFKAELLPDLGNATQGLVVVSSVHDVDYDRGHDRLVFTLYNQRTPQGATLLGTYDWDSLRHNATIPVAWDDLDDGAMLCVMDYERNAILQGQPAANVANMNQPVCHSYAKSTTTNMATAPVHRIHIEGGTADGTFVTQAGALLQTRRVVVYDANDPQAAVPAVTSALQGLLHQGVGSEAATVVAVTMPNLPATDELHALIAQLTARGTLVILPAGTSTSAAAFGIQGLAAHPDALTLGAAQQDGRRVRPDSAHGPSPLLRQKPDATVRVDDALPAASAQAEAVLYGADLALWYQLRGVADPRLIKSLVLQQAHPVLGDDYVGTSSATGAGVLDPADFTRNSTLFNRTHLPHVDLNGTLPVVPAGVVAPLPVVTPNALLDVGVVNRAIAKEGHLALENPNGLLHLTLDTHSGNILDNLADPSLATQDTSPLVTVNVTFYSLFDLLMHNLTDAWEVHETTDRLQDLGTYTEAGASYAVPAPLQQALLDALPTVLPTAHHFIPQVTVPVAPSAYLTSCRAPSMMPLRYHTQAAGNYLRSISASETPLVDAALQRIQSTTWESCPTSLEQLHAPVQNMLAAIDARLGQEHHAYLQSTRDAIAADYAALVHAATHSLRQATLTGPTLVSLATDPALTTPAPVGPYVGIVRITTHQQCNRSWTGNATQCGNSTAYSLATMTLVDNTSFVLRDRAGRVMPGRMVTLERLATPVNCAGAAAEGPSGLLAHPLGQLFQATPSHAATTDAQGIVRFPWVAPGYYDVHDGFVDFSVHTKWDTSAGTVWEDVGFGEMDCHLPVLVHGDLHTALDQALAAASKLHCLKTATKGLPLESVTQALDAIAAGQTGNACSGSWSTDAAASAAQGIRNARDALFGPEAWQIVFPQVLQARLVDAVQAEDVEAAVLGPPSATEWNFVKQGSRIAAVGNSATSSFASFHYSYDLPPNEELAMKWRFHATMSNTAGIAIFTIRDDVPALLAALAEQSPSTAEAALRSLHGFLEGTAHHGTSSCSPAAHYRIIPLSPMLMDLSATRNADGSRDVDARLFGSDESVYRYFRFHTRECQRSTAHAIFLFFPVGFRQEDLAEAAQSLEGEDIRSILDPSVHFVVDDQHIWTWAGVGWPAVDCPGDWCLIKLPNEQAMSQPYAMSTMDTSYVRLNTAAFDEKIEGWDQFVDLMDHTQALTSSQIPSTDISRLLVHPNPEASISMGDALDVPQAVGEWISNMQRDSHLAVEGMRLSGGQESWLSQAPSIWPDRNRRASGDYVNLDWAKGPTAVGPPLEVRDVSPRNAHPNREGTRAVPSAEGRFGGAYGFRGAGDYIEVPQAHYAMESGTAMMWIKPNVQHWTQGRLLFLQNPGQSNHFVLGLDVQGHVFSQTGQGGPTQFVSHGSVPMNAWSHVAVTWSPSGLRVYIDGQPSGFHPVSVGVSSGYTRTMLGNSPHDVHTGGYVGMMDDARLYEVVLDQATIASIMSAPYRAPGGMPSQNPAHPTRLEGGERFVYAMDAPPKGGQGHFRQHSILGRGAGFAAEGDEPRALSLEALLSPGFSLRQVVNRGASPSWSNVPSYEPTAAPQTYTLMLHATRDLVQQYRGAWVFAEHHPSQATAVGPMPTPAPIPTPVEPWRPGTNARSPLLEADLEVEAPPAIKVPGTAGALG